MNKRYSLAATTIVVAAVALFGNCRQAEKAEQTETQTEAVEAAEPEPAAEPVKKAEEPKKATDRTGLIENALKTAYPDFISSISDNKVHFTDGTTMKFDDGAKKDFLGRLNNCDVEDMFSIPYRLPNPEPDYLEDAGRMRSEELFKKMYGSSAAQVRGNLVSVKWFGQSVQFNKNNGAADSLRAVAREIANYPELKSYLKSSGTFNWRPVRGSKRMNAHSYGIAFDIAVDKSNYWQWESGSNDELRRHKYRNRIPRKLVEIFQKHGFIWGGSWYHYDTMHFEFRPDMLLYSTLLPPEK